MSNQPADSAATVQEEPDAFHQAMAEFTDPESAPAAAAGQQSGEQEEPPTQDQVSPPVNNPGGSEPPAGNAAPAGEPTDDVWKDVPEAARREWEKAQSIIASLNGRVSHEARRANQFERQLRELAPVDGGTSHQGQQGNQPNALLESDEFKQFQDEYPEIAAPIISAFGAMESRLNQLAAPVSSIVDQQEQIDRAARYDALAQRHPDWQEYAADPRWGEFVAAQPVAVQQMFERNVDVSDPDEAAFVLTLFKQHIGAASQPATASPPSAAPNVDPRRQRQLDAGRDAGSNGAGAAITGVPEDDIHAALAVFIQQDEQRRASLNR